MDENKPSKSTLKKAEELDPSGVNEAREDRAEFIKAANEADAEAAEAEQEAADAASKPIKQSSTTTVETGGKTVKAKRTQPERTAPQHVVKRDDEGAAEQQRAARRGQAFPDEFEGPPVVAPIIEGGLGKAKIELRNRLNGETVKDDVLFTQFQGRILGEGFPFPGEVILDLKREDGQDHQRFSTYTYDGTIDIDLNGINGPGTWVMHAESPVTQVGEGREDHLPVIRESDEVTLVTR